jgi:hypothetical protein
MNVLYKLINAPPRRRFRPTPPRLAATESTARRRGSRADGRPMIRACRYGSRRPRRPHGGRRRHRQGSWGGPHTPGAGQLHRAVPYPLTVNDVPGNVNRPPRVASAVLLIGLLLSSADISKHTATQLQMSSNEICRSTGSLEENAPMRFLRALPVGALLHRVPD